MPSGLRKSPNWTQKELVGQAGAKKSSACTQKELLRQAGSEVVSRGPKKVSQIRSRGIKIVIRYTGCEEGGRKWLHCELINYVVGVGRWG